MPIILIFLAVIIIGLPSLRIYKKLRRDLSDKKRLDKWYEDVLYNHPYHRFVKDDHPWIT